MNVKCVYQTEMNIMACYVTHLYYEW